MGTIREFDPNMTVMPGIDEPVSNKVHQLIDVLLSDQPLDMRISESMHLMTEIAENRAELPFGMLEEISGIIGWLKHTSCRVSSDEEFTLEEVEAELAGKLLPLYIEISGGGLIF
jgi:hypothetical protein